MFMFFQKKDILYNIYPKNLKLRFEHYKKGLVTSTRDRRPLILIYFEGCLNQQGATHREKYLKSYHENVFKKSAQILFNRVKKKF